MKKSDTTLEDALLKCARHLYDNGEAQSRENLGKWKKASLDSGRDEQVRHHFKMMATAMAKLLGPVIPEPETDLRHILLIPQNPSVFHLQDMWGLGPLRVTKRRNGSWHWHPDGEALVILWEGIAVTPSLDWLYRHLWSSYIVDGCREEVEDLWRLIHDENVLAVVKPIVIRGTTTSA